MSTASLTSLTSATTLLPPIPAAAIPISTPLSPSAKPSTSAPVSLKSSIPSFPPSSSAAASGSSGGPTITTSKKGSMSMSLSTNVSDLLLSSLLPPNLPKLPPSASSASVYGDKRGRGAPRELSSQREGLSLPLVSNNFRRFITRVGPIFWLQDRVEEVLFWRKPLWTWAWMMTWTFICFQPRTLLLLPSLILILILLHIHEKTTPLPSLLGTFIPPSSATDRIGVSPPSPNPATSTTASGSADASGAGGSTGSSGGGFSATTTKDAEGDTISVPAVPPKEVESGVDYYMNLQAIQNLMGLVSDGYDYIAPRLASLQSPNPPTSTLSLPVTPTHLMLLLLPPTLFLPLTPVQLIPYLLLPLGLAPPLLFHPNLTPSILNLPSHPLVRKVRAIVENLMLDDRLSDDIGRKAIGKVEVWENERLDPKIASSASNAGSAPVVLPVGSWGAKHLRPSDRSPWVKVPSDDSKWKSTTDGLLSSTSSSGNAEEKDGKDAKMVLALQEGWEWIPGEDWRIDASGLWSDVGIDAEGWVYSDDSWQNPAPTPYTEADSPADKNTTSTGNTMPGLALRRVTRRRRWWRRVYEVSEGV
ncbi:hypothetical protein I316_00554 [Kwoniella heveanensis BCC8398]|uniref:TECPR1-like DysF domain-containing protein n=1 Tax=Kwoniella heveanensis BCC8398 TaxID=1296120 RepID=A0A1B9H2D7_9TREE|nr:hypothetical protein I316_00554 [Kwoniella heveanensis BCC8398]